MEKLLPIREQYISMNMFVTHYLLMARAATALLLAQHFNRNIILLLVRMGLNSDTREKFVQGINLHVFLATLNWATWEILFFYLLLA